jgi:hypothetical protein
MPIFKCLDLILLLRLRHRPVAFVEDEGEHSG